MAQTYKANFNINDDGTKKVFDNWVLERLSRTPIGVPIGLYFILSAVLLTVAVVNTYYSVGIVVALFIAGLLTFSFIEYVMHRYLFHMKITSDFRKRIQYNFHGIHHEYPKDKDRLAMPIPVSIGIAAVLFFVFWVFIKYYTFGFLPGVLSGYAAYLLVHFIVHAYPPPKNIFKELWVNHAIHHYKDDSVVFGVSSPLWDYVFGTMPKKQKQS